MTTFIVNDENIHELVKRYFNGDITIPPLSQWNTENITNMSNLFKNVQFNNEDKNQDISQWNTCNVTNMKSMFYKSRFNQDISQWNTC
jgi:surface protein